MARQEGVARLSTGNRVPHVEQGPANGIPLVLLHAWGESRQAFTRLMPALGDEIHTFAFDQRGHRDADKPPSGYGLNNYAEDVIAFLDAMALEDAVLLGSSSGGYVAQEVAVGSPRRVRGLVLVGAPRSLAARAPFADEVDALTDPIDRAWVADSVGWFEFVQTVPDAYIEDRVEDAVRMPAHVWKSALAGLSNAIPPTEAGAISAPALVIHGRRDSLIPIGEAERLVRTISGSRLLAYEDAAHLVLWELPDRIGRDVTAWITATLTGG